MAKFVEHVLNVIVQGSIRILFGMACIFVFPTGPWQNRRARLAQDGGQPDPHLHEQSDPLFHGQPDPHLHGQPDPHLLEQPDPLLLGSRPLRGVGHCAPPAPHHLPQHCAGRHSSGEEGQYRCGTLTIWWMLNVDRMADRNGDEIILFKTGGL